MLEQVCFASDTQILLREDISASVTNAISVVAVLFPFSKLFYCARNRLLVLARICKNINRLVKSSVDILIFMYFLLIYLLYASLPIEMMKYIEINMQVLQCAMFISCQ